MTWREKASLGFVRAITRLQNTSPSRPRRLASRFVTFFQLGDRRTLRATSAVCSPSSTAAPVAARFFSAEEARRIIAAAPEPYATIYAVAAMTGLRAGELLGLKVSDIDFTQNLIFVQRSLWNGQLQAPKSQTSVRVIPIPESLAKRLARFVSQWKPNTLELLFATRIGTPIDASKCTQRKLQPLLKKLGIQKAGLHAFRHTCASLLVSQGASLRIAQQQLGHSDPRITLAVYSHVIGDSHRQAVEKLADAFGSLDPDGPTAEANSTMIQ